MTDSPKRPRYRRWLPGVLILCLLLSAALLTRNKDASADTGQTFSVLILGDSQMAGYGWTGGYANCIAETYPNAQVFNLAQNGSLLANGDIRAQWDYYRSETTLLPDFVLLDGGINDMPYLKREDFADTALPLVSQALCSLLEEIHAASPDTHIIYTLMPPFAEWKDSPDGPPAYEVQAYYWEHLKEKAAEYDYVTVLDLFSANPFQYPDPKTYRKNLADSIHLNEAGYRNTFDYVHDALAAQLTQRRG